MYHLINLFIKSNKSLKSFPIKINNEEIIGKENESTICLNCIKRECFEDVEDDGEYTCEKKLSFYQITINDFIIKSYGHIGIESDFKKGHSKYKNMSKLKFDMFNQIIKNELVEFVQELKRFSIEIETEILNSFHDATKWARQISISSEHLLEKIDGESINIKFNNADNNLKSVYKCSMLLNEAFQLYEISINSQHVDFGSVKRTQVYQLFDKFQAILFHSEGKQVNKSFRLSGESHSVINTYATFTTIPLCLLQNALKYHMTNEKIIINFKEVSNRYLKIDVISEGPVISDEEKIKIFEKNFRGKYASRLHHDGLGIGLYVAKNVAEKHNSVITVESEPLNREKDKIPLAKNTFTLSINLETYPYWK